MSQFYGLYTVKSKPFMPESKEVEKGTFVTFRAYTRLPWQIKTENKEGEEVRTNYSDERISVFVRKDKEGNYSKAIVDILLTPGTQVMLQGYTYESRKGDKYYRNFEAQNFWLTGKSDTTPKDKPVPTPAPADEPMAAQVDPDTIDEDASDIAF